MNGPREMCGLEITLNKNAIGNHYQSRQARQKLAQFRIFSQNGTGRHGRSFTNATGSHEGPSHAKPERRYARKILAQAVHEARLAGMRDKDWVSEYQTNNTLP